MFYRLRLESDWPSYTLSYTYSIVLVYSKNHILKIAHNNIYMYISLPSQIKRVLSKFITWWNTVEIWCFNQCTRIGSFVKVKIRSFMAPRSFNWTFTTVIQMSLNGVHFHSCQYRRNKTNIWIAESSFDLWPIRHKGSRRLKLKGQWTNSMWVLIFF